VGPERKEHLEAHDSAERGRQQLESLLAESRRLLKEMHAAAAQSAQLGKQHAELAKQHAELLETLQPRKPAAT
jgi:hypothetical protein